MEIIKYNIEKLGGMQSTLPRNLFSLEMEPSLMNFEMRNIEKNMESVNHRAVHPKHFNQDSHSGPVNRNWSAGRFPYGGTSGPVDPKESGQYMRDKDVNPDLSNYPCSFSLISRAFESNQSIRSNRKLL